ncbi:DNA repair protein RadA [Bacteroidota bacterium]
MKDFQPQISTIKYWDLQKSKSKSQFVCQQCGANSAKWIGRCPSCGEWNTYSEEIISKAGTTSISTARATSTIQPITEVRSVSQDRLKTGMSEFDRLLGGGLVPGSMVLIGGEPGIGKSTLALQIALLLERNKILYLSGEESAEQIRIRADRIGSLHDQCLILNDTWLENILSHMEQVQADLVIIDSIQTLYSEQLESSPGTISQIRECTTRVLQYTKDRGIPVILIGHINKEGHLAGPKVLEHIVDVVLQFEGDRHYAYRILRATKNRFGATSELGIFEMTGKGLREISNPSEILLSHADENMSGIAIAATLNGNRPFLIEVQALVSSAVYGTPQRSCTGFDIRRLNMLLAVLEKRAGFRLGSKDVFLNIAGGIKVDDPAIDLSVIVAILSSSAEISIDKNICFAAEVGLSGEVRPVSRIDQRIAEAEKLGFQTIFVSKYNKKGLNHSKYKIGIKFVGKVEEVFKQMFG